MKLQSEKPDAIAKVVIHSISEDEFEIMEIEDRNERMRFLSERLEQLFTENRRRNPSLKDATEEEKKIYEELVHFDCIFENAVEELSVYGDTAKDLHNILWASTPEEMYHTVNVDFFFEWDRDYWAGEEDLLVNFEYEVVCSSKEYEQEESVLDEIDDI